MARLLSIKQIHMIADVGYTAEVSDKDQQLT